MKVAVVYGQETSDENVQDLVAFLEEFPSKSQVDVTRVLINSIDTLHLGARFDYIVTTWLCEGLEDTVGESGLFIHYKAVFSVKDGQHFGDIDEGLLTYLRLWRRQSVNEGTLLVTNPSSATLESTDGDIRATQEIHATEARQQTSQDSPRQASPRIVGFPIAAVIAIVLLALAIGVALFHD